MAKQFNINRSSRAYKACAKEKTADARCWVWAKYTLIALILFIWGCSNTGVGYKEIVIKNPLDIDRASETIGIPRDELKSLEEKFGLENLLIKEKGQEAYLVRQLIDYDLDGEVDEVLFQIDIKGNEEKHLVVEGKENGASFQPDSKLTTYSRFIPERTDDYTWENDRVAFRTYGPEAQRLAEEGSPDGTLSSGIDLWLKRVEYAIIDKWYEKNLESIGYYHIDHGEGYDPYHVGPSRGVGGTGVYINDSIYVSKNFTSYKTIATGPIRTVFELTYASWKGGDQTIAETKRISLDLGSNFTHFEIQLTSNNEVGNYMTGITLHDKKGEVAYDKDEGWISYWEPMNDVSLGTAIVTNPKKVKEVVERRVNYPDQSHILAILNIEGNKVDYYAGFFWEKSNQFGSKEEWEMNIEELSERIQEPLIVTYR